MNYRAASMHFPRINQTLEWFSTDNEEWYQQNLKNKYEQLEYNDWIDKKIQYKFNSLGFRSEEFIPEEDSIVFLGGSEVMSVGITIEHSFTTIVSQALNLKCYNLGQSGGSNDSTYRLASYWLPVLKPKLVIIVNPPPYRVEVINTFLDNPFQYFIPHYHGSDPWFKTWLSCDDNSLLNEEKNMIAIEYICEKNNLKLVRFQDTDFERIDYSRDLVHNGIKSHSKFAEKVLNLV